MNGDVFGDFWRTDVTVGREPLKEQFLRLVPSASQVLTHRQERDRHLSYLSRLKRAELARGRAKNVSSPKIKKIFGTFSKNQNSPPLVSQRCCSDLATILITVVSM